MTYIWLSQEKKTYSHKQYIYVNSTSEVRRPIPKIWQNRWSDSSKEKIAYKIIIKERRTRKVSQETLSHSNREREEKERDLLERLDLGLLEDFLDQRKRSQQETLEEFGEGKSLKIFPPKKKDRNQITARTATCSFAIKYSVVPTAQGIVFLPYLQPTIS